MINQIIGDRGWSQKKTAYVLEAPIADVSRIRNSKPAKFSLERLLIFLVRLNYKVTISIKEDYKAN
jgi:predicted XRE-type DNA-binding protein